MRPLMHSEPDDPLPQGIGDSPSVSLFEDRYGIGSQERLLALLRQPCVTFASIAQQFGVTRECVRRWHRRLLPDAPSGHARQRLCRLLRRRQRLLQDRLILGFYRRIRAEMPGTRLTLIPSRDGFRTRRLQVNDRVVALTRAQPLPAATQTSMSYALARAPWTVDFVYCELGPNDFLFLPRNTVPSRSTILLDGRDSPYLSYKNTFAALAIASSTGRASAESVNASTADGGGSRA